MSKIHYFYWGFTDSGKNYVNRLSRLNEKVLANFYDNHILKTYTKVHIHDTEWDDVTFTTKIIHDNNGLKTVSKIDKRIFRYNNFPLAPHSTINNDWFKQMRKKGRGVMLNSPELDYGKDKLKLSDEQRTKYSDWKYHESSIYFKNATSYSQLDLDEVKNHIDEIMEDIDMSDSNLMYYFEPMKNILRQNNSVNIIPYKVNLLDSFISKLDGFQTLNTRLEDHNDLFEVYEQDKERIWKWLDFFLHEQNFLVDKFKANNIPYVYFNLDEDNYTDLFVGWDNSSLPRDCTHRRSGWVLADESEKWKYKKVEDIAKEYMTVRQPKPLELR